MSDTTSDRQEHDASRMELEPDAFHEGEDGLSIDCPQCGATVPLSFLISERRCPNSLDPDEVAVESEETSPQDVSCSARLDLELVWWADG